MKFVTKFLHPHRDTKNQECDYENPLDCKRIGLERICLLDVLGVDLKKRTNKQSSKCFSST